MNTHNSIFWRACLAVLLILGSSIFTPTSKAVSSPITEAQVQSFDPTQAGFGIEMVQQWGGQFLRVEVAGDLAYALVGQRMYILSLANPAEPVLVGKSELLTNPSANLAVQGHYAYLADSGIDPYHGDTGGSRLHIMNISNPAAPYERSILTAGQYGYQDVDVYGDYAYLGDYGGVLSIVNISNPDAPERVKSIRLDSNRIARVTIAPQPVNGKTYIYALTTKGLFAVDVTDPTQPAIAGSFVPTSAYFEDFVLDGDRAFISDDGLGCLRLIDLSDPTLPAEIGTCTIGIYPVYSLAMTGSLLAAYDWELDGIRVMDASGAGLPVPVGFYPVAWINGMDAIVLNGAPFAVISVDDGLRLVDLSKPASPALFGSYQELGSVDHVKIDGDLVYLSNPAGLDIYRRTDPGKLAFLGSLENGGQLLQAKNGIAYQFNPGYYDDDTNGWVDRRLILADVSNPTQPTELDSFDISDTVLDVFPYEDNLYVAANMLGLLILDAHDSSNLSQIGSYDTPGFTYGVTVMPDPGNPARLLAFLADDENGLLVLDVTDPQAISQVALYSTMGLYDLMFIQPFLLDAQSQPGDPTYLAAASKDGDVFLLDATVPVSITVANMEYVSDDIFGLTTTPGKIYPAAKYKGVRLFTPDLSDQWLVLRGYYRYPKIVYDLAVTGDFIYLAAGQSGLFEVWQAYTNFQSIETGGGTISSDFYPLTVSFPTGTFTETTTVIITPRFWGNLPPPSGATSLHAFFNLSTYGNSPQVAYQMEFVVDPAVLNGKPPDRLAFYYWDGINWIKEPTSQVDVQNHKVSASPDHFSIWAILLEWENTWELHLPVMIRQ